MVVPVTNPNGITFVVLPVPVVADEFVTLAAFVITRRQPVFVSESEQ
jgi:hypothetical protein